MVPTYQRRRAKIVFLWTSYTRVEQSTSTAKYFSGLLQLKPQGLKVEI